METMEESHLMRLMNSSPHAALISPVPICSSANSGYHKVAEVLNGNGFSSMKKRALDVVVDCDSKRESLKYDQPLDFSKKPKIEMEPMNLDVGHMASPTRTIGSDDEEVVLNLCRDSEPRDNYMSDSGASSAASESPEMDRIRAAGAPLGNGHVPGHPPTPPAMFGHLGPLTVSPGGAPELVPGFPVGVGPAATSPVFPHPVPALQSVITGKGPGGKATRPFKAYPRDPLSISMGMYTLPMSLGGMTPTEALINQASNDAYSKFRERMMSSVQAAKSTRRSTSKNATSPNSDRHGSTSPVGDGDMGRSEHSEQQQQQQEKQDSSDPGKDDAYWERRRKNNEAAKRSRDARRAKEDEIAIRAAFLEQENLKLRIEVAALKNETAKLRCLLYNS